MVSKNNDNDFKKFTYKSFQRSNMVGERWEVGQEKG